MVDNATIKIQQNGVSNGVQLFQRRHPPLGELKPVHPPITRTTAWRGRRLRPASEPSANDGTSHRLHVVIEPAADEVKVRVIEPESPGGH
jgi:hypothetical protein